MTARQTAILSFATVVLLYAAFRFVSWDDKWPDGLVKILIWVVPCLLVLRLSRRIGYRGVLQELGLYGGVARGCLFGAVSALPMFLVLPFQGGLRSDLSAIIAGVALGPFAEEVLFRGFLFRQLHRHAGWHPRTAILASALAFGLAHGGNVELGRPGSVVLAVGEVGMTALGGVLFAWVVFRWNSLWPAIALHTFMNLSWEIFGVDDWASQAQAGATAIGPVLANIARLASITLAVYLTLRWRRGRNAS